MKRTNSNKITFWIMTALAIIGLVVALVVFTVQNGIRIRNENREYLVDNASQVAASIDSALSEGYNNIQILSELVSRSLQVLNLILLVFKA